MRITGKNSSPHIPQESSAKSEASRKKDTSASSSKSTAQSIAASAERFAKATGGRLGQLLRPAKPNEAELRSKVPEGTIPESRQPERQGNLSELVTDMVSGPAGQSDSLVESLQGEMKAQHPQDLPAEGKQTDGRHPDSQYRGGGDLGLGNPYAGMDRGAAGKLPAHQQAALETLNESMKKAAEKGDLERVNIIASEVSEMLGKGPGTDGTEQVDVPAASESAGEKDVVDIMKEGISQTATGKKQSEGGVTPTQRALQDAEDEMNDTAGTKTAELKTSKLHDEADREKSKTGEQASGANEIAEPFIKKKEENDPKGSAQDREEEIDYTDRTRDFTDRYFDMKVAAESGSEINPGDDVQGSTVDVGEANSELYTGNFGGEQNKPTEEEIEAGRQRAEDNLDPEEEY